MSVSNGNIENLDNLLKRAKLFIEDGDYEKADEYCERALDIDAENGTAYLYKLLVKTKFKSIDKLSIPNIMYNNEYQKVVKYADAELRNKLSEKFDNEISNDINEMITNDYMVPRPNFDLDLACEMLKYVIDGEKYQSLKTSIADHYYEISNLDYMVSNNDLDSARKEIESIKNKVIYDDVKKRFEESSSYYITKDSEEKIREIVKKHDFDSAYKTLNSLKDSEKLKDLKEYIDNSFEEYKNKTFIGSNMKMYIAKRVCILLSFLVVPSILMLILTVNIYRDYYYLFAPKFMLFGLAVGLFLLIKSFMKEGGVAKTAWQELLRAIDSEKNKTDIN